MNVAMLSKWHVHAGGYASMISQIEGCKIAAVWDEVEERGKSWADELNCPFIPDYRTILADPSIDAVVINSPTNLHAELMIAAAKAGKHIFTEKVMTLTKADAEKVRDAVREAGIHFTISFPMRADANLLSLKKLVDDGKLGRITYGRIRNCHGGSIQNWLPPHFYDKEQCGGGAMMDLGAHPMYLITWLLGNPVNVSSHFTNIVDHPVEDNAVSVITFENGAIGVSETGFVSTCDRFECEISGTEGFAVIADEVKYRNLADKEWRKPEPADAAPQPMDYWVDSIKNNTENKLYNIDDAYILSALMDAAYRSADNGVIAEI